MLAKMRASRSLSTGITTLSKHCLNCCIDKGGVELAHFCLVLIESFVRDIGSHQDNITTYQ